MKFQAIWTAATSILTLGSFIPYYRSIIAGTTIPHVFSWTIWSITTILAAAAQWAGGAGPGAYPTLFAGILTIGVGVCALFQRNNVPVASSDLWAFLGALSAIPIWGLTQNPLWASLSLSVADAIAFWPTIHKCWSAPHSEPVSMYLILFCRNGASFFSLSERNLTTVLFPATMNLMIVVLLVVIEWRGRAATVKS